MFDVSLSVGDGEVLALLGANGAGKTTVLRSILGLTRPRRGDISFQGQPLAAKQTHEIARAGIGWVPDDRRICPTLRSPRTWRSASSAHASGRGPCRRSPTSSRR